MAKSLLSIRAYARHRGVAHRAVQKAIEAGRITLAVGPDGKKGIDPEVADREWTESTDQSKQRKAEPEGQVEADAKSNSAKTYAAARAMREVYQAKMAKLAAEEREGRLVDAKEMRAKLFELTRATRDALLNLPNRIAPELAAESDPVKIHNLLTKALTSALEDLVNANRPADPGA